MFLKTCVFFNYLTATLAGFKIPYLHSAIIGVGLWGVTGTCPGTEMRGGYNNVIVPGIFFAVERS